jgi:hypothetical protein
MKTAPAKAEISNRRALVYAALIIAAMLLVPRLIELIPGAAPWLGPKTTLNGFFEVCLSEKALARSIELSSDMPAQAKYLMNQANGCTLLQPNLPVVVEDCRWNRCQIRLPGDPTSAWVSAAALGPKR